MRTFLRTAVGICVGLSVALGAFASAPLPAAAAQRISIDDFMTGLACTELGGRYTALNTSSGSYGKYQIMPRIWLAWAARYMGNRWADPTPRAQEFVAQSRILDLYALHHRWPLVAHWWLTGNADPNRELWSLGSTGYVDRVISTARDAANPDAAGQVPAACFVKEFAPPRIRTTPLPRVEVAGGRAFLRVAAGYENRAIGTVKSGTVMAVLGAANDARGKRWLHVGLPGGTKAWVASWLTTPHD